MSIALCFVSYTDCEGMYRNYYDIDLHDIEETIQDAEKYYESIGIEEFMIADTWSDDSELEHMIVRNICYSESYLEFQKNVAKFLELIDDDKLKNSHADFVKVYIINSENEKDVDFICDTIRTDNIYIYSDMDEVISEYAKIDYSDREEKIFDDLWNYLTAEQKDKYIDEELGLTRIVVKGEVYYYSIS